MKYITINYINHDLHGSASELLLLAFRLLTKHFTGKYNRSETFHDNLNIWDMLILLLYKTFRSGVRFPWSA
jgi:hypothetical protein